MRASDALIAAGLAESRAADDCPGPGVLAAFHERSLEPEETARCLGHVADCPRCQAQLAAIGRAEAAAGVEAAGAATGRAWWSWPVLAPLAAVSVVVLAVWVVAPGSIVEREVAGDSPSPVPRAKAQEETAPPDVARAEPPPVLAPTNDVPASASAAALRDEIDATSLTDLRQAPTQVGRLDEAVSRPAAAPAALPPAAPTEPGVARSEARATSRRDAPARESALAAAPPALRSAVAPDPPLQIRSPDPLIRWRILPDGNVERTGDGGRTWRVQITPPERVTSGAAPGSRVAWLVGERGLVLRTTDGDNWDPATTLPVDATLTGIEAMDELAATVTTADGRRFRTVDGGRRWVPQP